MRKMIKWKPFYSIPGLNSLIKEIENEKKLIEKPTLSEDLIENIDYTIKDALKNNFNVQIKYWKQGMLKYEIGKIKEINPLKKYILVNNTKIYFKYIINVKV